ncbi:multidrug resistance-associated protein 4 isoform X2 [Folsomia candida]|uniref:multidrug resistance-associated protein 4 isoform X2 n=1 Tax=Folsomia candida TaxID=158441 RepID=UPI001605395A|nr:multidrug resistance-associated protein 4 isoform X2 [Folsomia candida]
MDFTETKLKRNPVEKANPISRLFFLWLVPLFRKGYKQDLVFQDLYTVIKSDHAETLGDKLEAAWNKELESAKIRGKKPSLSKVLSLFVWKRLLFSTLFYCFDAWIVSVSQPLLLRALIQTVNDGNKNSLEAFLYAGGICITTFAHAIILHPTVFTLFHMGMQYRVATSALIYRKALRLSKASQGNATVGKLVNLLSNDTSRFDINMNFIPFLAAGPVQFIIFSYFLYDVIGPACFAGIGFIVLLLPMMYLNGKYSAKFRLSVANRTDTRGKIMNELIVGIRVIKMYAWEVPFSMLIDQVRKLEVDELKKRAILKGINLAVINFGPKFIAYVTFLVYVLLDNQMSSEKVFFTLTTLYVVTQIMAAAGIGEILVATQRIEEFLLLEEQTKGEMLVQHLTASDPEIRFENVTASWTKDRITLDDITLNVSGDKLLMVVGAVGSGKSSFLHSLIAELSVSRGQITVSGTTSYASQEPWIFAGNLRQNILFGQPFDSARYWATVKACELDPDLIQLPFGDQTIVGERGVALSGGQKARVGLARALYRKSLIYLLDDPLSAVDSKVSRQLFEKCIRGYLAGSLRVLVTHQLQYLPQADQIVVLHQGKILAQGNYDELVSKGIDFVSLMTSESGLDEATRKISVVHNEKKTEEVAPSDSKPEKQSEKMLAGSVTGKTYLEYFNTAESFIGLVFLIVSFLMAQVLLSGNDYWLSFWANDEDRRSSIERNETGCIGVESVSCENNYLGRDTYLLIYTGFNVGAITLTITRGVWFFLFCCKISINLHDRMFRSLVRAPTKFFDENPSGRVMNRFTKDVGTIDELLPPAMSDALAIFLNMIGVITVVIISNVYLSVPTVFLFIALYLIRLYFVQTARSLKRLESLTRSPLFTHLAATMQGISTIRASNTQSILVDQFDGHQDMHSSAWYLFLASNRWFGIWLELISCGFLTFVAFSFLIIASSSDGGNIGLAISSVLTLMGSFQWGMRQSAETENFMTSVERAQEYVKLESEAPLESNSNKKPPSDWPIGGQIRFQNVFLTYGEKPVLKNLTFEIGAKEKVGIVGRTGAGKSSMIAALFRMTEPMGEIFIDGVNIGEIGLHDLRKSISIIPQDPVLFSGDVRYNLDPFGKFQDLELWRVIEEVELKDAVPSLDFKVADGGSNFSVGQRQLVCLARAILRKNRVLLMDEATASVDARTDALIQKTIRSKFSDCTIITIAHRLHSVIDCDKILVLDHGNLEEFGHPYSLLQNTEGKLTSMVAQTGKRSEAMLRRLAQEVYSGRRISYSEPIPEPDDEPE